MSSSDESPAEEESILNNLSKTRQLWSSKAEIASPNALIPKPSTPSATSSSKQRYSSTSESQPTEVVKADEQVIEDYELPDISRMKSQFETRGSGGPIPVPMPSGAKQSSTKKHIDKEPAASPPVPVNREEEVAEETYEVELGKLKAQFETAAANAPLPQPKSPKRSVSRSSIKEHVNKSPSHSSKQTKKVVKHLRFEDEIAAQSVIASSEPLAESEGVAVDLSGLKSQFENRKDERMLSPLRPTSATKVKHHSLSYRSVETDGPAPEVVRPDDAPVEEHYEVELSSIKKRFEQASTAPSPPYKTQHSVTAKKEEKVVQDPKSPSTEGSPPIEIVKSYEASYDEMIGEESVKDRLQKFKSLAEKSRNDASIERRPSQKKTISPVKTEPVDKSEAEEAAQEETSTENLEIVRSPPAGSKITPDYVPSVDLRQTKALFEQEEVKPVARKASIKRSNSSSSSSSRTGRSFEVERERRNSSHRSSSLSSRSKSPASSNARRDSARSPSVHSSNPDSDSEMANVYRPPPAGTKETPDYVPTMKLSSVKSMFEKSNDSSSSSPSSAPRPRRSVKTNWVNGNDDEANKDDSSTKVVAEGSYEERDGGVVRPPSAGTKERPVYSLGSDFLKSRAAMFDAPKEQAYTPRNKIKVQAKPITADVVNKAGEKEEVEYAPTQNLKDTKKMFEGGAPVSPGHAEPTQGRTEVVKTEHGEIVRPPPAGTRDDSDIVRASNLGSVKKMFEGGEVAEPTSPSRKQPIDIRQEAAEVVQRDHEVRAESRDAAEEPAADSESETEGEYLLDKDPADQQKEDAKTEETTEQQQEPAAVTPVRVAVPDSPTPEEQEEQEEAAPEVRDDVTYDEAAEEQEEEPEAREAAAEEPQEEEEKPDADDQVEEQSQEEVEDAAAAENPIIDDHLLRSDQQDENGADSPQEEVQQEESNSAAEDYRNGSEDTNGADEPDQQQEAPGKGDAPQKEQVISENGGGGIAQDAGKFGAFFNTSVESVDSDYDKPHFHYPYDDEKPDEKTIATDDKNFLIDDLLSPAQVQPAPAPNNVDLLNGFDAFNPIAPAVTPQTSVPAFIPAAAFASTPDVAPKTVPDSSDPFDLFSSPPPPSGTQAVISDPFDIFAAPVAASAGQTTDKDPFDLFL